VVRRAEDLTGAEAKDKDAVPAEEAESVVRPEEGEKPASPVKPPE